VLKIGAGQKQVVFGAQLKESLAIVSAVSVNPESTT
jgi:hypothetical protein